MNMKKLLSCLVTGLLLTQLLLFPVCAVNHNGPSAAMDDVPQNAWYRKAVDWVITHEVMNGFSATSFGPDKTLTRAQVVQVLYNKEGKPALNGKTSTFSDVSAGQWYTDAVTWACAQGIVSGYTDGTYKPDKPVSLEEAFVILWNYVGNPPLTGDADAVGIHSEWAGNAIGWAQASGVLGNFPYERVIDPATRAQTAQMLMNLFK